ncbi:hypothetical protein AAFC00_001658 [Neodothiora populina]|uniref:Peptidase C15, pyroglutamyl peptidase I-like protein n=1 Tax=Neodothiora populina TaxID=2781224 RepID=A0ABR3PPQ1_9PEZI
MDNKHKTVTVLLTGFGPFGDERVNPSYLIASTLPATIPPTSKCPVSIQITLYPYQIPPSYAEIRNLVPRLYAAYENIDMVLHMGMIMNRNYYSIEKLAHRDNYDVHEDRYGKIIDKDDGKIFWPDCPPILETSLDFDDIFQRWRSILLESSSEETSSSSVFNGLILRPSIDAGHYLCDFIYYSMLAEHWRRKKDRVQSDKMDERPVMFMHVPGTVQPNLRIGQATTVGLLRAMAMSWISRKSDRPSGEKGV